MGLISALGNMTGAFSHIGLSAQMLQEWRVVATWALTMNGPITSAADINSESSVVAVQRDCFFLGVVIWTL